MFPEFHALQTNGFKETTELFLPVMSIMFKTVILHQSIAEKKKGRY